jgi:antirestriction protein ArdC
MAHRFAPSARADVYTRITDEIVAAIEKGAGEWRMPWRHDGGSIARPRNVASDRPYRGRAIFVRRFKSRTAASFVVTIVPGVFLPWAKARMPR